jgi:hypothetical protein
VNGSSSRQKTENTDHIAPVEHRDAQQRSETTEALGLAMLVLLIQLDIRDVNDTALERRPAG